MKNNGKNIKKITWNNYIFFLLKKKDKKKIRSSAESDYLTIMERDNKQSILVAIKTKMQEESNRFHSTILLCIYCDLKTIYLY